MKTSRKKMWKNVVFTLLLIIFIAMASAGIWFFVTYFSVDLNENTIVSPSRNLIITDENSNEIPVNSALNKYATYSEIDKNIVNAFVAVEDKRFLEHHGVDYRRLIGAMAHNVQSGYWKEGGSTITQQLIKNTQLSTEKSLTRKVKEIRLAYQIEKKYSKEEILEMYLNAIYFGNGIYGIDEACKQYFDKSPLEISVPEAAILAGVVKNPRKNSLLNSIDNANARKNLILRLMFEQNMIDESEYQTYIDTTIMPAERDETYRPYSAYVDAVLNEASEILNISEKELIEEKYHVVTYLNAEAQEKIYNTYRTGELLPINKNGVLPSYATLSTNQTNGGVNAYVSNVKQSVFDFRRQPGSAIKPFLAYLPAIEKFPYCALSKVEDAPISYNGYAPKNYKGVYNGTIPLKQAVAISSNAVAVRLANETGLTDAKALATRVGITFHENDTSLPIVLGGMTDGVTFLELASAYSAIGNLGIYTKSAFVKAIFDQNGKTLYQRKIDKTQAFSKESATLMTDMLEFTVTDGTAKKLARLGYPIAAKTGTVGRADGGNNDAWCAAYTTDFSVISWYGNLSLSDTDALDDTITGGSYPTLVMAESFKALQKKAPSAFQIPYTVVEADIDKTIYDMTGEFYLVPNNFPTDLRLSSLFNAKNAPELFSPNAVVKEPDGLDIYLNDLPMIGFVAKQNEVYHIYRETLMEESYLTTVEKENGFVEFQDKTIVHGGFHIYRIEVQNLAGIKENFYLSIIY